MTRVLIVHPADRAAPLDGVRAAGAEPVVLHPERYDTEDALLAAARREHPDAVFAVWEGAVEPAAAIAANLGLPGNSVASVRAARDKAVAAQRYAESGVPHPRMKVFDVADDPAVIDKDLDYPFVVKLPRSTNSQSVTLVHDRVALKAALTMLDRLYHADPANRLRALYGSGSRPVLAQEYVTGVEFNIDLLYIETEQVMLGIFEKHPPSGADFGELHSVYPTCLPEAQTSAVVAVAVAAVRALGATRGAAHVELRMSEHGPVVIETGLRPGGFLTAPAIRRLTGVDPIGALSTLMLGGGLPTVPAMPDGRACLYGAANVERTGRVTAIHHVDAVRALPGIVHFELFKRPGDRVVTLPEGADYHIAGFLVDGATRHEVESTARRIREMLVVEVSEETR